MSGAGIFVPLAVSAGQRQNSREKSILMPIWKSNSTNLRFSAILSVIVMSWSVRSMIRILFLCHGNICRSPMAEFMLKDLVKKRGMERDFLISSSATSAEEIGNPVHPGTASRLAREGISTAGKYAVQLKRTDYDRYDYFLGMDQWNVRNMKRILGGDPENKVHLLLDFTGRPGEEIADPWYTGDFERTYADILEGCTGFLRQLEGQGT